MKRLGILMMILSYMIMALTEMNILTVINFVITTLFFAIHYLRNEDC